MAVSTKLPKVTQYVKNVGKSVAYASINAIEGNTSGIKDFLETNDEILKQTYSSIRNFRDTLKSVDRNIKNSNLYKAIDAGLKNAIEDAKTGKFYNDRSDEYIDDIMGDEDGYDFNFDDDDLFSDDDRKPSVSASTKVLSNSFDNAIGAAAVSQNTTIAKSTELTIKSNNANTRLIMANMEKISARFSSGMGAVFSEIDKTNKFLNGPMVAHMENSRKYYEETTNLFREQNSMIKELLEMQRNIYKREDKKYKESNLDRSMTYNGNVDLKGYAKNIKDNLTNDVFSYLSMFNMSFGGNSNPLMAIAAAPWQFALEGVANKLINPKLKKSLKSFDKTVSSIFPWFISRMNDAKENGNSEIMQLLGRIFGITIDKKTRINVKNYNKGAVPFDGITRKAIIETIPGYLSRIESAITGASERHFDYQSGTWKSADAIYKEYKDEYNKAIAEGASSLINATNDMLDRMAEIDKQTKEQIKQSMDSFVREVWEKNGSFDRRKDDYSYHFKDKEQYEMILDLLPKNAFKDLAPNMLRAQQNMSKRLRDHEEQGGIYTVIHNGMYENDGKGTGRTKNPKDFKYGNNMLTLATDSTNRSIFDYLREILDTIQNNRNMEQNNGNQNNKETKARGKESRTKSSSSSTSTRDSNDSDPDPSSDNLFDREEEFRYERLKEKFSNSKNPSDYLDEFGEIKDEVWERYKRNNKTVDDKSKLGNWIRDKFDNGPIGKLFGKMFGGAADILSKPMDFVTKMINKADENLFKLMFGKDDLMLQNGEKAESVFQYIIDKIKTSFDDLKNYLKDLFNPVKEKIKGKLQPLWENHGKPIMDEMKGIFTKGKDRAKQGVNNTFGRLFNAIGRRNSDTLTNGGVVDANDIQESAYGRYVTKRGLTMISPGEMIIPASFDKNEQRKMLALERQEKKRIVDAIGFNASGNVDSDSEMMKNLKTIYNENLGKGKKNIASGAVGGIAGLLTGINPLLGAMAGAGISILSNSNTLKTALFGSEIRNDKNEVIGRDGTGLIPKKIYKIFEKSLPDMGDFGIAGGLLGLFTPLGPLGGAVLGAGLGMLKNNETFNKFIFGDQETGKGGLIKKETYEKFKGKLKKAAPRMAVGAIGAAVLGGPFGILGNSVMGAGLGLLSSTNAFHNFIFGSDPKKKGKAGLLGAINRGIVDPAKEKIGEILDDFKSYAKKNIFEPMKNFFEPLTQAIKNTITSVGDSIKDFLTNMFEKTVGIPIFDFLQEKIFKPVTKTIFGVTKFALKIPKLMVAAPFRLLGGIGNSMRMGQIKKGNAYNMTAEERLAFRNKHKGRAIFGALTGTDRSIERDELLNSMTDEQLQALLNETSDSLSFENSIKMSTTRARWEMGNEISDFFNQPSESGTGIRYDHVKYGKVKKKIAKMAAEGDIDGVRNYLSQVDGLSENEKRTLLSKIEARSAELRERNSNSVLSNETFSHLDEDMRNTIGNQFAQGTKGRRQLKRLLEAEIENRAERSPEEKATNELTDVYKEKADSILAHFSITNDLLRRLVDRDYRKKRAEEEREATPDEDTIEAVEEEQSEQAAQNTENQETQEAIKTNKILEFFKEKLFAVDENKRRKGLGVLTSIGDGFQKVMKFLGIGGKIALAAGGVSLLGHASEWLKTSVWPKLKSFIFGKKNEDGEIENYGLVGGIVNGIYRAGETIVTKFKETFGSFKGFIAEKLVPEFVAGLGYAFENIVGPVGGMIVANLPSLFGSLIKGIIGGLKDIIIKKKADGQEEKYGLAAAALADSKSLTSGFEKRSRENKSKYKSIASPSLRAIMSRTGSGNINNYITNTSNSSSSSLHNKNKLHNTSINGVYSSKEIDVNKYNENEINTLTDPLTKKASGIDGLLGVRENSNIVRYDKDGNVLTVYDQYNTQESGLSRLAHYTGINFLKSLSGKSGWSSRLLNKFANSNFLKPKLMGNPIANAAKFAGRVTAKTVDAGGTLGSKLNAFINKFKNNGEDIVDSSYTDGLIQYADNAAGNVNKTSKFVNAFRTKSSNFLKNLGVISEETAENIAKTGFKNTLKNGAKNAISKLLSKAKNGIKHASIKLATKVKETVVSLIRKLTNSDSPIIKKVFDYAKKFSKKIKMDDVINAIKASGDDIAEAIAKKGVKASAKKFLGKVAGMIPYLNYAIYTYYFLKGYNNAYAIFKLAKGDHYTLSIPHKIIAGLAHTVSEGMLIGILLSTESIIEVFAKYILPLFGFDYEDLEKARKTSSDIMDDWNKAHPEDSVDNIEDYNDMQTKLFGTDVTVKDFKDTFSLTNPKKTTTNSKGKTTWWSSFKSTFSIPKFLKGNGRSGKGRSGFGHLNQSDPSISGMRYGNSTIGESGCAPVAATNLINSMGYNRASVNDAARYAEKNNMLASDGGTNINYFNSYLGKHGIPTKNTSNSREVLNAIMNGNQVVMLGRDNNDNAGAPFGTTPHYITAKGMDSRGRIIVEDPDLPNAYSYYDKNKVMNSMSTAVIAGGKNRKRSPIRRAIRLVSGKGKGYGAESILNVARAQVGVRETPDGSNNVKYNTAYYGKAVNGKAYPWCCAFVWWVFNQAGANKLVTKTASCAVMKSFFDKKNRSYKIGTVSPQPGDLVYFGSGSHIGIVESYDESNKIIYTIEGNTSGTNNGSQYNGGMVAQKERKVNGSNITYILRPEFPYEYDENSIVDMSKYGDSTDYGSMAQEAPSSNTKSDTIFDKITNLGTEMIKKLYGEDVYAAFYGDSSSNGDGGGQTGGTTNLTGSDNAEKIWNYLKSKGYSDAGAAGIMGNMAIESGLDPSNLQNSYEARLGNDAEYTAKVNSKSYSKDQFSNDSGGYGLCQWTYPSRKRGLYGNTIDQGKNINDLGSQLDFMQTEMSSSLKEKLQGATDYTSATDTFMNEFEAPGVPHRDSRVSQAKIFYDTYSGSGRKKPVNAKSALNSGYARNTGSATKALNTNRTTRNANNISRQNNSGMVDYSTFLQTIVTILMSISDNTALLTKVIEILSSNLDINVSKSDLEKATSNSRAQTEAAIQQLLRNSSNGGNAEQISKVLNDKDTNYIISAMRAIAGE